MGAACAGTTGAGRGAAANCCGAGAGAGRCVGACRACAAAGGGVMEVRGIAGAPISSLSESGAFADGGDIWFEPADAREGTNAGVFEAAGAEREFGILAFDCEPGGIIDDGAMFASVGSGRIGTVRTFFGSPIAIEGGATDAVDELGGRFGATAVVH